MDVLTILYWTLIICAIALTIGAFVLGRRVMKTLDQVEGLVDHVADMVADARSVKDSVKSSMLHTVSGILRLLGKKRD